MKYPPTPVGAETLRCASTRGFGGLSASSEIRRSINPKAQESVIHRVRVHPRAELVPARRSVLPKHLASNSFGTQAWSSAKADKKG